VEKLHLISEKLRLYQQFSIWLPGTVNSISNLCRDFTAKSYGVLSNSIKGGLKKDLSMAFAMQDSDFNTDDNFSGDRSVTFGTEPIISSNYHGVGYLYKFESSEGIVRGPTWQYFRNFANLYKHASGVENMNYESRLSEPRISDRSESNEVASAPMAYAPRPPGSSKKYPDPWTGETIWDVNFAKEIPVVRVTDPSLSPRVSRMQLFYSLRQVKLDATETALLTNAVNNPGANNIDTNRAISNSWIPSADGENVRKLQLVITPVVTLWNPYNVPIKARGIAISLKGIHMQMRISWFRNVLAVSKDLSPTHAVEILNNDCSEATSSKGKAKWIQPCGQGSCNLCIIGRTG
jgi:hypothetical protein